MWVVDTFDKHGAHGMRSWFTSEKEATEFAAWCAGNGVVAALARL